MKIEPKILGDVHLGRKFTNGVPLHRRGDRERMVNEDFANQLMNYSGPLLVQPGDLFDSFAVPEAVVLFAYEAVKKASIQNPNTGYIFIRGNHDASRDTNRASSFDVFAELIEHLPNVHVFRDVQTIIFNQGKEDETCFGFVPWHPFKSADVLAEELIEYADNLYGVAYFDAVFGHWDVESYGGDHTFNMVPTRILSRVTKTIYTGHIHKPTAFDRDGVRVNVVGSMQPYAHGEEQEGVHRWYRTIPYGEYTVLRNAPEVLPAFHNANVRVIVQDGEAPEPIDCLSFTTKKAKEVDEGEEGDIEVAIAEFNMDSLFAQTLAEQGVSTKVADLVSAKFKELRNIEV